VTCHDLLAVRAARDEFRPVRTRWTGRQLQRAVVHGLRQSRYIVCDSEATRSDVGRIPAVPADRTTVIPPCVSPSFAPVAQDEARDRVRRLTWAKGRTLPSRFVLHVGGNQWYKNRRGVIDIYAALVERRPDAPSLVMAGRPLTADLQALIDAHELRDRVVSLDDLSDRDLAALYSLAELLLFPSIAEGFGWPVLEALACGCPVVTSNRAPMTEVAGDAVTYIDPVATVDAAAAVDALLQEPAAVRRDRLTRGLARASHFSQAAMADAYVGVYQRLLDDAAS
jgi:glycosyltransferase involved in cell wall biosynthesis